MHTPSAARTRYDQALQIARSCPDLGYPFKPPTYSAVVSEIAAKDRPLHCSEIARNRGNLFRTRRTGRGRRHLSKSETRFLRRFAKNKQKLHSCNYGWVSSSQREAPAFHAQSFKQRESAL